METKLYIRPDGIKEWYQDGKRHRTDGPAVEYPNGAKWWYQNDQLHRTDGSAIEGSDGSKEYWVNGKELTQFEIWTLFKVRSNEN